MKMSKGQTLRALVNERLAAAAEEIFVLFERTITEYEEELCRSEEENQRKQLLLDKVLIPRFELVRGNIQTPSQSPGLNKEITKAPQTHEKPRDLSLKQEEEQLPLFLPESSAVCVKTDDPPRLQQRQSEHREESQGADLSSEPHFHSETDHDEEWESPFSCPAALMETEMDGDLYNQVQIRVSTKLFPLNKSAPETIVHNKNFPGADGRKHQCPFCAKRFSTNQILKRHIRVHTGEKPFSCLICRKNFVQKCDLNIHVRTHTGEKPYSCAICKKTFSQKGNLDTHSRTHTGEKPYRCPVCNKAYSANRLLKAHMSVHTGQGSTDDPDVSEGCFGEFEQIVI